MEEAVRILRKAYDNGINYFDTAHTYSDSEEKVGIALSDVRSKIFIATKTGASTPDEMKKVFDAVDDATSDIDVVINIYDKKITGISFSYVVDATVVEIVYQYNYDPIIPIMD